MDRLRTDFGIVVDEAVAYFSRSEAALAHVPRARAWDRLERDHFWSAQSADLQASATELASRLMAVSNRIAGAVRTAALTSASDQHDLAIATKTMRAALHLREFRSWLPEVVHDEGTVLAVHPAGQSDDEPCPPEVAARHFCKATEKLQSILDLVVVSSESDGSDPRPEQSSAMDSRAVFVVYGRHALATEAMFAFLSALGLRPLEWSHLVRMTGKGAPYVGEVLEVGFARTAAAVVLLTPDDEARLQERFRSLNDPPYETALTGQARPNVIFEAGMALGVAPQRTILVEFGTLRPISDLSGRHVIRIDSSEKRRRELAERLETAGCAVDLSGEGWKTTGDFDAAICEVTAANGGAASSLAPGYTVETSHERLWRGKHRYDIDIPQIQGLTDSYMSRRINGVFDDEFKRLADLLDHQGLLRLEELSPGEDNEPIAVLVTFEIGLATSSLISLRVDHSLDLGGIHPVNATTGFVVDLVSGYRLSLRDLFRSDQNYNGILRAHIQGAVDAVFKGDPGWEAPPPEPDEGTPRPYDFYLTERELVVVNLFESHALHGVWARIPLSELFGVADPRGPLHRILAARASG